MDQGGGDKDEEVDVNGGDKDEEVDVNHREPARIHIREFDYKIHKSSKEINRVR